MEDEGFCMAGMYCMRDLLELVLRERAEELHLCASRPPALTVGGEPLAIAEPALTIDEVAGLLQSIATEPQLRELGACGKVHFIHVFQESARFAVTALQERDALSVTIKNLAR